MNMIEKVARAIVKQSGDNPDTDCGIFHKELAKAAIEAMQAYLKETGKDINDPDIFE